MGDITDYAKQLKQIEQKVENESKPGAKTKAIGETPKKKTVVKTAEGEVKEIVSVEKKVPADPRDKIVEALERFTIAAGHCAITQEISGGQTIVKKYARPEAWKYLAELCDTYTAVVSTSYYDLTISPYGARVEVDCELRRKSDDFVLSKVTACATPDEPFIKSKGLPAMYGLATTRAEERAVRSVFGHYMAAAGLNITPYSEIDDKNIDLERA